jgi:predicted aldo/keto reductase-like oxidoreductase
MEYRSFAGMPAVSLLGFGAMRLPKVDPAREDIAFDEAKAMLDAALAGGVNYIDTAWPYHEGMSESFLGEALAGRARDSYVLATKLPVWEVASKAEADELFAKQLAKLRTDFVDFYLLHSLDGARFSGVEDNGLYDWGCQQKAAGRIGHLGFSFHGTIADLERILNAHTWDFAQIQLNWLDWELQEAGRAYQMLVDADVPVVIMEPVRGGALANLPADCLAELKAADETASPVSWALRFAGSLPGVLTVLSGMSTLRQVEENLATFTDFESLGKREQEVLEAAKTLYQASGTVPCTGCRYCMDCPYGVDIPRCFALYNQYKLSGNAFGYNIGLSILGDERQAQNCTACGSCLELCPQHIDIPDELEKLLVETEDLISVDEFRAARARQIALREAGGS